MPTKDFYEKELTKELARRKHLNFIQYCWGKNDPFLVGVHTVKICSYIDYAFDQYRKGKSTFAIIQTPPQHGKSDILSRYLPPHFLAEFPEKEAIIVSHCATQAYKFSKFGRKLFRSSDKFRELYPHIHLAGDSQRVENWELDNGIGKAQWFGVQSGIAGNGGDCNILDDYFANRGDADSAVMKEKVWNEFTDGMLTRRHDPSIFIIVATQWDVDDIIGRYTTKMKDNPKFPQAEIIKFPARSDSYESGYLFPEMYSKEFYEDQEIFLGSYGWLSLYQQTPTHRGGNLFQIGGVNIIDLDNETIYPYGTNKVAA